jgi:hypothetical protein
MAAERTRPSRSAKQTLPWAHSRNRVTHNSSGAATGTVPEKTSLEADANINPQEKATKIEGSKKLAESVQRSRRSASPAADLS